MTVESKELAAATRSVESSEQTQQQVYKQQHQPPSETQQILTEPHGDYQGVDGGEGASTESDWVISFGEILDPEDDTEPSIYKVPHHLREGNDKAYVPQIVSLGPYHQGKEHLRPMDPYKMCALTCILRRNNEDKKIYLDSIEKLEGRARDCYEGKINLNKNEFSRMLVLDGCFVLELFRVVLGGLEERRGYKCDQLDTIFAAHVWMNLKLIQRDMIMLENQIPLFILDRLLELQLGWPDQRGRVARLAVKFFRQLLPAEESLTNRDQNIGDGLHFLDVCRQSLLQTRSGPVTTRPDQPNIAADKRLLRPIRCVTELRDAGIKFKKRDSCRFWDMKFRNAVLEIPRLLIDDSTELFFLNVIAFEQRRLVAFKQTRIDWTTSFSSYVLFMYYLIDSSKDVRHLDHCGIIENWLGNDDEVAQLFDRLWRQVVIDINRGHFSGLSNRVNNYCSKRWPRWRAELKHKYFSSPWTTMSVIGGVVLLLLTFIQTFYTVYGYYRSNKA